MRPSVFTEEKPTLLSLRCDIHINGSHRKLVLVPQPEESREHLALRLSAFVLFWELNPKAELSMKNSALADQEFRPDLIALGDGGDIALWVECGNVSLHKLDKLTRRYPYCHLVVLKATETEGKRLRRDVVEQVNRQDLIRILCWPQAPFQQWTGALRDTVHIFGEVHMDSLNLVINETPLAVDLIRT